MENGKRLPVHSGEKLLTEQQIQVFLTERLATMLKLKPEQVDPRKPFAEYGVDSAQAVEVSADLEDLTGLSLEPTLLWDFPTIEQAARHLAPDIKTAGAALDHPSTEKEPIAVVGMSCRFPGASDLDAFWKLLDEGKNAITEVPAERWDADAFYDPDSRKPGKMNTRWGGFIERADQFDAGFFGIAPREAAKMDPQHRLLLETAWEALENAGQVPHRLAGRPVGVFVGISQSDYADLMLNDPELNDAYFGTGNALSIAANRISYTFGFRGPSLAIDTACSSSLVAVYQACQSIWNCECEAALAAGANLTLSPQITVNFTKTGFLSPTGRCKPFDASADGYVRGEGVGVVVLKPLSKAVADGDSLYAVIRGGAVNNDGRTNGLMAPSGEAQQQLLREAYRRAGVSPGEVQYVEAHGTGTVLGDPIEVKAMGSVLAAGRKPSAPCAVGSVKSNIGHLEGAAGIAGFIKVALMLKHRRLVSSLHVKELNPYIPFDQIPVCVQRESAPWPEGTKPALAGVSSFGFGGTNCHLVLEEAPATDRHRQSQEDASERSYLLPISSRSAASLKTALSVWEHFLEDHAEYPLSDICHTAGVRRSHHDCRAAILADDRETLIQKLKVLREAGQASGIFTGEKQQGTRKAVYVFAPKCRFETADLDKWKDRDPLFRETMERLEGFLQTTAGWSLSELQKAGEDLAAHRNFVYQAVVQMALAASWLSRDIKPSAVIFKGASGRITQSAATGDITLEEAVRRLLDTAGDETIGESGWEIRFSDGTISAAQSFAEIVESSMLCDCTVFLEMCLRPALFDSMADFSSVPDREGLIILPARSDDSDLPSLPATFGSLYALGFNPDWQKLYPDGTVVPLPAYPWDRSRYWYDGNPPGKESNGMTQTLGGEEQQSAQSGEQSRTMVAYYKSLAQDRKEWEEYLSFAPFSQVESGFSWLKTMSDPAYHAENNQKMLEAQTLMRKVMFRTVDFSKVGKLVEIGCGYASDLIRLAQSNPAMQLHGCNISEDQIEIARSRIGAVQLHGRVNVFKRDIVNDSLPDRYDMVLGVQVMHHIQDKRKAFANIANHLKDGAVMVLAEILSNSSEAIRHPQSTAFFATHEEWADCLAEQRLQIIQCVDTSREIGNFLYDPDFYENLAQLEQNRNDIVREHLEGPHLLGELLRRGAVTYGLLTVQKTPYLNVSSLREMNRERLCRMTPFTQVTSPGEIMAEAEAAPTPEPVLSDVSLSDHRQLEAFLRRQLAQVLEMDESRVDVRKSMDALGLDSIMAIDLKQRIERELRIQLQMSDLLKGPSIEELASQMIRQPVPESAVENLEMELEKRAKQADSPEQLLERIGDLSDEEVDRLLGQYRSAGGGVQ